MRRFSLRREVALGLGVYALYLLVSRFVLRRGGRERAAANAAQLVALEERLGVHVEPAVQRALLRYPRLVHGLNVGYGLFNVTLTVGWLVRLYRRRDAGYHRFRRVCLLAHVGAQPVFLLYPTAPPRRGDGPDRSAVPPSRSRRGRESPARRAAVAQPSTPARSRT